MKTSELRQRLQKDRPMVSITLRMPEDVVDDMKNIAPYLGFSGYQPLIRHYVGQGLRVDKERFARSDVQEFANILRRHGIDPIVIDQAMSELAQPH
ncbi:MAG: hypothetical protein HQM03_07120 [Magnetococcales bacterium]|nr:hypothetical protein [Magnetococcales bacterium]